ncbi:MAG: hypothetical protein HY876_09895 [Coriobacteriales bacterium]|nr:hypothetical protein [Coriobacteriales bacterium]
MPDAYQTQGESAEQPAAAPSPRSKRRSIFADPVVRGLALVAALLVILYLSTVLAALLMGILSPAEPRTRVERDIRYYEQLTKQTPKDTEVWANYVGALILSKQYLRAQDVIDRASKSVDQAGTQDILAAQAKLYVATKKHDKAIKTADEVRAKLRKWYDSERKKAGSPAALNQEINENYYDMLLVKAEAQAASKDKKAAVKTLGVYLKDKETAADVFVRRGILRAETGDKKGAEKDFRRALKFIPDDTAALNGLKQIGVER